MCVCVCVDEASTEFKCLLKFTRRISENCLIRVDTAARDALHCFIFYYFSHFLFPDVALINHCRKSNHR